MNARILELFMKENDAWECSVEIEQIFPFIILNGNELIRKGRPSLQHGGMKRNGTYCRVHKHRVKVSIVY